VEKDKKQRESLIIKSEVEKYCLPVEITAGLLKGRTFDAHCF